MTNHLEEFLENQKKRGIIVERCTAKGCNFRGWGRATVAHEMHTGHTCMNEDSEEYANAKYANSNPMRSSEDMRKAIES